MLSSFIMFKKSKRINKKANTFQEFIKSVFIALILALIIRSSLVQAFVIPSGSMLSTLEIGDQLMVNKMAYNLRLPFTDYSIISTGEIKRGDVIVFMPPVGDTEYIKRVIGLPGDVLEIKDKKVFINGRLLREDYVRYSDATVYPAQYGPRDNFGPVTVPIGKLFVMGDNRDESADSRFWGFAEMDNVEGKAGLRFWSWDARNTRVRWSRLLTWVE